MREKTPRNLLLFLWPLLGLMLPVATFAFGRADSRNADECRAQVNANYDALTADMRAHGNTRGAASVNSRARLADLADCDQMEQQAQQAVLIKAYDRLSAAIDTIKSGKSLSDGERRTLYDDHETILKFPHAPYREACLRLFADYERYASVVSTSSPSRTSNTKIYRCTRQNGQIEFSQLPCTTDASQVELTVRSSGAGSSPTWEKCEGFRMRIDETKKVHDAAVAALLPAKSANGTASHASNWRELEQQRTAALSQWQLLLHEARMAGCNLK